MSVITKDLGVATAYGYAKSKGYTGTEEEFAELMASYADVAQQAEAAAQDAEDAKDEAVTAKTDAQTAKTAAQAAQSAAETASGTASAKASEAAQSAQSAAGSASAAGNSATAAAGSASTAQTAAQTATTKASEAASSASAASTAKTGAETARTGAQTAQAAAETAQENAEEAAASVSASAAQIEQNTEEIGAIKNDLSEKADKSEALSAYIVETETGAIASFTDGADDVPVKDLQVAIEPVQSGSGDPSPENVRPISGWTGAVVSASGKNLLAKPFAYYADVPATLSECFFIKAGQYIFHFDSTSATSWRFCFRLMDKNGNFLSDIGHRPVEGLFYNNGVNGWLNGADITLKQLPFTIVEDCFIRIVFSTGDTSSSTTVTGAQLELGTTATAYEPYQGETVSIDWTTEAGTVYGGTLDVTTGVLTVDRAYLTNAQLVASAWTEAGRGVYVAPSSYTLPNNDNSAYVNPLLLATALPTKSQNAIYTDASAQMGIAQWWGNRFAISFADASISTATAFKTKLAENGSDVVYPLATPQTYQLTPEEVSTVLGQNNIFADTGNVTVQYRADTKLYIDKVLSA